MIAHNYSEERAGNTALENLLETDKSYYQAVSRVLVRIAAEKGLPPSESERVVGESWKEAFIHCGQFPADGTSQCVLRWLQTTVRRKAENARRRLSKHPCHTLTASEEALIDHAEEQHTEATEQREWLYALFARVPRSHAENVAFMCLHYLEEISIQDLAHLFRMTPDAVDSRIRRELKELRELAEKHHRTLGDPPFGRGRAGREKKY
jgi:DNA-directed RNA polymerase specialized sigma24 family protein